MGSGDKKAKDAQAATGRRVLTSAEACGNIELEYPEYLFFSYPVTDSQKPEKVFDPYIPFEHQENKAKV